MNTRCRHMPGQNPPWGENPVKVILSFNSIIWDSSPRRWLELLSTPSQPPEDWLLSSNFDNVATCGSSWLLVIVQLERLHSPNPKYETKRYHHQNFDLPWLLRLPQTHIHFGFLATDFPSFLLRTFTQQIDFRTSTQKRENEKCWSKWIQIPYFRGFLWDWMVTLANFVSS